MPWGAVQPLYKHVPQNTYTHSPLGEHTHRWVCVEMDAKQMAHREHMLHQELSSSSLKPGNPLGLSDLSPCPLSSGGDGHGKDMQARRGHKEISFSPTPQSSWPPGSPDTPDLTVPSAARQLSGQGDTRIVPAVAQLDPRTGRTNPVLVYKPAKMNPLFLKQFWEAVLESPRLFSGGKRLGMLGEGGGHKAGDRLRPDGEVFSSLLVSRLGERAFPEQNLPDHRGEVSPLPVLLAVPPIAV